MFNLASISDSRSPRYLDHLCEQIVAQPLFVQGIAHFLARIGSKRGFIIHEPAKGSFSETDISVGMSGDGSKIAK